MPLTELAIKNLKPKSKLYRVTDTNGLCLEVAPIRRRYSGTNNGEIPLSVREAAERLHCGKSKAQAAFDELINRGFIKIGEDSSFNRKTKTARRWILTDEVHQNTSPTNEWKSWKI